MIPAFNDDGYLPAGVHRATLEEVAAASGGNRTATCPGAVVGLVGRSVRRAAVLRLIVNGSFATDWPEPNDVDCVLLIGAGFPRDAEAEKELLGGLPFIELKIVGDEDFALFVERIFASDRQSIRKGMIEVVL